MGSINISFLNRAICYAIIVFVGFCSSVRAESWQDSLYLNGFFTLDLTTSDSDIPIVNANGESRGFERGKINANNSLIGGQIEYAFTNKLSVLVQGTAAIDGAGSLTSEVDWAYISYDFGTDWVARAGKFQTPFLQGIELSNIGYSRIWARPIAPSGGANGFNYFYGAELLKHVSIDDHNFDFQFSLGQAEHSLDFIDNKNMKLASVKYQRNDFWLRTAIMQADYSIYTPRNALISDSAQVLMSSVEAELTFNQFILNLGYSNSSSDITPDDKMSYASLAYSLDNFIPYILIAKRNQFFEAFDVPIPNDGNGGPPAGPPDGPPGLPPPENSGRPTPPDGNSNFNSYAAGVRWNFASSLALKLQVEKIDLEDAARVPDTVVRQDSNTLSVVLEGAF